MKAFGSRHVTIASPGHALKEALLVVKSEVGRVVWYTN